MYKRLLIVLVLLCIPAFSLMLRPGIYTMHDFHVFRQFEFDKCVKEGSLPCRWAPDSENGYGEPLFNFYTQAPYWLGEVFHLTGFSIISSVKLLFILSLVLSGLGMFILARSFWGTWGGLASAILYVYAPYRAVDVWVRGALPEAMGFVFYPLVLYALRQYIYTRAFRPLLVFTLSLAGLISTHNLSLVMFVPLLGIYWIFETIKTKSITSLKGLVPGGLVALSLSAYYLIPVALESKYIDLSRTVSGYYDYHIHFATLKELFITRFWGYGGSLWMQKFLSVSVGQVQWVVVLLALILVWRKSKSRIYFLAFSGLALFALFMTHGKSALIWNSLPFMKYIQFPWRYLTSASFFIALAGGFILNVLPKAFTKVGAILLVLLTIGFNYSSFRPDIWHTVSDRDFFSGSSWDANREAHKDYWPKSAGAPPVSLNYSQMEFVSGSGELTQADLGAHVNKYQINVLEKARVRFPIVYFPGWKAYLDAKPTTVLPDGDLGLMALDLPMGDHAVELRFTNTTPRIIGNSISLLTIGILGIWISKNRRLFWG